MWNSLLLGDLYIYFGPFGQREEGLVAMRVSVK